MNSHLIVTALRRRYPSETGEYVTATEVAATTGGTQRRCDFLALSCWRSRGLELHGFEIKVSRADWLRELKAPAKVEEGVYRFCSRWYVVAPPGVVNEDELPPPWGLMEARPASNGTRVTLTPVKKAPPLTPEAPTRGFMASFVRSITRAREMEIQVRINTAAEERVAAMRQQYENRLNQHQESLASLQQRIRVFQQASGINLTGWMPDAEIAQVGGVVRLAQQLGVEGRRNLLVELEDKLTSLQTAVRAARAESEALFTPQDTAP